MHTKQSNSFANKAVEWSPHEYQRRAIEFMITSGVAGLFMDPGLGKTATTLAAYKILKDKNLVNAALVIAPLRVCHLVWPNEVKKWANFNDLKVTVLHGPKKEKLLDEKADIYLINPEGLQWLLTTERMGKIRPDMLVVDESTKFKRTTTQRFKLLKKWLNQFSRRYILTGTPAPKGLLDLFGQIYLLDQGASLGRFITHYKTKYFVPSGYMGYDWQPQPGATEKINDQIGHMILRLEDKDYLEMPELIHDTISVELPPKVRKQYNELEKEFITMIENDEVTAMNAGTVSNKLRQIAGGGIYTDDGGVAYAHSAKADALVDLLEQLQGAPLLVFYQFRHDVITISKALPKEFLSGGKTAPYIGGGVSGREADTLAKLFNNGDLPVLLAHPASAGHGLNLQGASNHVCFYSPTWDLEHHDQALRRVYRQGQKESHVVIHHIVAAGTVDEVVVKTLVEKDRTQRAILDGLKKHFGDEK